MVHSHASKRITLAAVARHAGVAESTASRVMNGYTRNFRVRPEVRQRVLDAARELNYKPNPMVRSIAAKKTNLIAIIGQFSDEETTVAVQAAARVLIEDGKHVCTSFLDPDDDPFGIPSWRVDGAIAVRPNDPCDLETLVEQEIPCVAIEGAPQLCDAACVDQRDAVRLAFEHLLERGHETTVYVEFDASGPRSVARRESYLSLCEQHRITPTIQTFTDESGGAVRILRSLTRSGGVGVIASSTPSAMRLLQSASELGIRTPDELSIVCLGETEMTRLASPALTCVRLPFQEIGRSAARLLLDRIDSPDEPRHLAPRVEYFSGELVVRGTTSAPVAS